MYYVIIVDKFNHPRLKTLQLLTQLRLVEKIICLKL